MSGKRFPVVLLFALLFLFSLLLFFPMQDAAAAFNRDCFDVNGDWICDVDGDLCDSNEPLCGTVGGAFGTCSGVTCPIGSSCSDITCCIAPTGQDSSKYSCSCGGSGQPACGSDGEPDTSSCSATCPIVGGNPDSAGYCWGGANPCGRSGQPTCSEYARVSLTPAHAYYNAYIGVACDSCNSNLEACSDVCVDKSSYYQNNDENCGSCGNQCNPLTGPNPETCGGTSCVAHPDTSRYYTSYAYSVSTQSWESPTRRDDLGAPILCAINPSKTKCIINSAARTCASEGQLYPDGSDWVCDETLDKGVWRRCNDNALGDTQAGKWCCQSGGGYAWQNDRCFPSLTLEEDENDGTGAGSWSTGYPTISASLSFPLWTNSWRICKNGCTATGACLSQLSLSNNFQSSPSAMSLLFLDRQKYPTSDPTKPGSIKASADYFLCSPPIGTNPVVKQTIAFDTTNNPHYAYNPVCNDGNAVPACSIPSNLISCIGGECAGGVAPRAKSCRFSNIDSCGATSFCPEGYSTVSVGTRVGCCPGNTILTNVSAPPNARYACILPPTTSCSSTSATPSCAPLGPVPSCGSDLHPGICPMTPDCVYAVSANSCDTTRRCPTGYADAGGAIDQCCPYGSQYRTWSDGSVTCWTPPYGPALICSPGSPESCTLSNGCGGERLCNSAGTGWATSCDGPAYSCDTDCDGFKDTCQETSCTPIKSCDVDCDGTGDLCIFSSETCPTPVCPVETCNDNVDNDGDGLIDEEDADCPITLSVTPVNHYALPLPTMTATLTAADGSFYHSSKTKRLCDYTGCKADGTCQGDQFATFAPGSLTRTFTDASVARFGQFDYTVCYGKNDPLDSIFVWLDHCADPAAHSGTDNSSPATYSHNTTGTPSYTSFDCSPLDFNCQCVGENSLIAREQCQHGVCSGSLNDVGCGPGAAYDRFGPVTCDATTNCTAAPGLCSGLTCYNNGSYAWRSSPPLEICDDGLDNDCNGLVDTDDPVCIFSTNLTGYVRTETGAGLAAATVSIVSPPDGFLTVSTSPLGFYRIDELPPGTYSVSAKKDGLRSVTKPDIVFPPGASVSLNFTLNDGNCDQCADWTNTCSSNCSGAPLCGAIIPSICDGVTAGSWANNGTDYVLCCSGATTKPFLESRVEPSGPMDDLVQYNNLVRWSLEGVTMRVFIW